MVLGAPSAGLGILPIEHRRPIDGFQSSIDHTPSPIDHTPNAIDGSLSPIDRAL